jgi:hypothetical protein
VLKEVGGATAVRGAAAPRVRVLPFFATMLRRLAIVRARLSRDPGLEWLPRVNRHPTRNGE